MSAVFSGYFIPTVEIKLPSVQDRLLNQLRTDVFSKIHKDRPELDKDLYSNYILILILIDCSYLTHVFTS